MSDILKTFTFGQNSKVKANTNLIGVHPFEDLQQCLQHYRSCSHWNLLLLNSFDVLHRVSRRSFARKCALIPDNQHRRLDLLFSISKRAGKQNMPTTLRKECLIKQTQLPYLYFDRHWRRINGCIYKFCHENKGSKFWLLMGKFSNANKIQSTLLRI